jgi:hypothetical protein
MSEQETRKYVGSVKVGPASVDVYEANSIVVDGDECYGVFSGGNDEIEIVSGLNPQRRRATLFHELIHAVDFEYDIRLSEKQTRKLHIGLLNLIDDNPGILELEIGGDRE